MTRSAIATLALLVMLTGCDRAAPVPAEATKSQMVAQATAFPIEAFATLGDGQVSPELAADLQEVLDESANDHGITATLITSQGTWSGATGMATRERAMVPNNQMSIASITKTLVAAQVMELIEAGELSLDDLAADRLPPDLKFDTNGATIEHLSMRSGISEYFADEEELREATMTDPLRVWTLEEKLATVAHQRGPLGQGWEYIGTNYLLLGLIIEQVTGRPVAEVLRAGVLDHDGYERLIYQPDERPTEPMAMPLGAPARTFEKNGGYLPSLANATMFTSEGAMASDAPTLARWFRALCAGQIVSPASLHEMTDFEERPEYGLGIWDRRSEYGSSSPWALGHTGLAREGYRTAALCFQDPTAVVVVLANSKDQVEVDTVAGDLVYAAST